MLNENLADIAFEPDVKHLTQKLAIGVRTDTPVSDACGRMDVDLWRACQTRGAVALGDRDKLHEFDAEPLEKTVTTLPLPALARCTVFSALCSTPLRCSTSSPRITASNVGRPARLDPVLVMDFFGPIDTDPDQNSLSCKRRPILHRAECHWFAAHW